MQLSKSGVQLSRGGGLESNSTGYIQLSFKADSYFYSTTDSKFSSTVDSQFSSTVDSKFSITVDSKLSPVFFYSCHQFSSIVENQFSSIADKPAEI